MNIIIAGCGKVGRALAEQLSREKHDITVIDRKPEAIQQITNIADVRGVVGNGASFEIQMDAGIDTADLMIAVTDADEVNLLCCLIAKKAGGCQTIARVRNPVYHHEIHHIKDELGLSMVINPEWAAAMPFYATTIGMWIIRIFSGYFIGVGLGMGIAGVWIETVVDNVWRERLFYVM